MLNRTLKIAALASAAWLSGAATAGELTVFSGPGFQGQNLTLRGESRHLHSTGFNDRIGSMIVRSGRWEVCLDPDFSGDCRVFEPGEYRSLDRMTNLITSVREIDGGRDGERGNRDDRGDRDYRDNRDNRDYRDNRDNRDNRDYRDDERDNNRGGRGRGRGREGVEMYSAPNFAGERFMVRRDMRQLTRDTFDDRAASLIVRGGAWEVCQHPDFGGRCQVVRQGEYPNLGRAFTRSITSVRQVGDDRGPGRGRDERNNGRDDVQRDGVELFSTPGFGGERFQVRQDVRQMGAGSFDDRAASVIVYSGEWAFCQHPDFGGQCVTYGPGRYDLGRMSNQVTSIRRVR